MNNNVKLYYLELDSQYKQSNGLKIAYMDGVQYAPFYDCDYRMATVSGFFENMIKAENGQDKIIQIGYLMDNSNNHYHMTFTLENQSNPFFDIGYTRHITIVVTYRIETVYTLLWYANEPLETLFKFVANPINDFTEYQLKSMFEYVAENTPRIVWDTFTSTIKYGNSNRKAFMIEWYNEVNTFIIL